MMKTFLFSKLLLAVAVGLTISPAQAKDKDDKDKHRHENHDDHHYSNRDRYNHYDSHRYYSHGYSSYGGRYYGSRPYYYNRPRTSISIGFGTGYTTDYYRPVYRGQQVVEGRDASLEISVQRKLARLGYYDGEADGDIGPASRRAIIRFQRDNDLAATGRIDRDLVAALGLS